MISTGTATSEILQSAGDCEIEFRLTYSPASATQNLISLSTSNTVDFAHSGNNNDANAYTITIQARNVGETTWSTSATATYTYSQSNPCQTATITAAPYPPISTSVLVPKSSSTPLWYDSVSGSASAQLCGGFTVELIYQTKPASFVEATMGSDFSWTTSGAQSTLSVSPTYQPQEVGSYQLRFKISLTNYPTQFVEFVTLVQITDCILTSVQVVESVGFGALSQKTYLLNNTPFSYALAVQQTPSCGYPTSNWLVTSSGTNSASAPSFAQIDSVSGVYGFAGMNQAERAGTYTIVVNLSVNGVTYIASQLVSPSEFFLTVDTGCSATVVNPSSVNNIALKVWDALAYYPLSGAAYPKFTDSVSTTSGNPSLCPKTYTATVAPTTLTTFNLNAATRQFQIYSDSFSQVGTYTVTLRAEVTLYPSKFATTSFTVTVQDPCLTTTLIQPTPGLAGMTTSVLVATGPVTQQVGVIKDQVSVSYGDATGTQYCGNRQYSISSVISTIATAALDALSLSVGATNGLITLQSSNPLHVGTHTVTVAVSLSSFPSITLSLSTFTITIQKCAVTSVLVVQNSDQGNLADQTYTLSSTQSLSYPLAVKLTPNCGYTGSGWQVTATGPQPTNFQNIDATGTYNIQPTQVTNQIGVYAIQVSAVTVDGVAYTSTSLGSPSSFNLNVVALGSCDSTIVTATAVSAITLKVWDAEANYPLYGDAFLEFTDSVSTSNNDPLMCPKTYSATSSMNAGGMSLTDFQLESDRTFRISSQSYNQIGTYTVTLRGEVTAHPTRFAETTFIVTVTDPCLNTVLVQPVPAPTDMVISVLLATGPVTQQIGTVKDQVSVAHGDTTGTQYCGPRQYSITSVLGSATTALDASSLSIVATSGLITLQSSNPLHVGTHSATVAVSLTNYPSITLALSTFTITIQKCAVTSIQIVQNSDQGNLADQTYTLSSTQSLSYPLAVKLTPNCGYTGSGWQVTATGPQPTNFQNIDATGTYNIQPTQVTNQIGMYAIQVTAVTVDGVTYTSTSLVSPSSFNLNVVALGSCDTTIVTATAVSAITLKVWDAEALYPTSGAAFLEFTDSVSTSNNDPSMCPKTYSATSSTNAGSFSLTTFQLESGTKQFRISSQSYNQIGTYTVTLRGQVTAHPTRFAETTFIVTVTDPCLSTLLVQPLPAPTDMAISVLLATGPVTQQIGTVKDQVSVDHGAEYCGPRQYSIASVVDSASAALDTSSLSIDSSTGLITLQSSNSAHVGTHTVTVTASLSSYPSITLALSQFIVTITPCVVTAVQVVQGADQGNLAAQTYALSSTNILNYQLVVKLTPVCGYTGSGWQVSATGVQPANFQNINAVSGMYIVGPTTVTDQMGIYTIQVVEVTVNSVVYSSAQLVAPSSFTLTIADPCSATIVTSTSVSAINLSVWDSETSYPITGSAFLDFTDSVSTLNNNAAMCAKTYSATVSTNAGGSSLSVFQLETGTNKFRVSSQAYNQIGTYTVELTGKITNFPTQFATSTFLINVIDPCLTTTLIQPTLAPLDMEISVLLATGPVTQQIGTVKDQVSVTKGDPSGTQYCGARQYSISSAADTGATAELAASDLTIDQNTGIITLQSSNTAHIGIHLATVVAKLTSYPSIMLTLPTFTITITPCVVTSVQVVQLSDQANLVDQTYTLSATLTLSYGLAVLLTPNCGYVSSGWAIIATGPNPTNFNSIDSATGIYSVGPIADLSQAGSYTIQISAVTVNGVVYGTSPTLLAPSSFVLNVMNPCEVTTVQSTPVSSIILTVWDLETLYPSLPGTAFADFTDSQSQLNNDPHFCAKTYSATVSTNAAGASLTNFFFDAGLKQFKVSSQSYNQIGIFTVTLTGAIAQFPSQSASTTFTITVNDPCITTTLQSSQSLQPMQTSVLVQASPGGSPLYVNQQVEVPKDQISLAHGDGTGFDFCGPRQYSISSTTTTSTNLVSNELIIDINGLISVYTANNAAIGTHDVTVVVSLTNYPNVTPLALAPFTLEITACIVTSYTMASLSPAQDRTYTIMDPTLSWSLVVGSYTTQVPACGYTQSFNAVTPTFVTLTPTTTSIHFQAQSTDLAHAGIHSISVESTLVGYAYSPIPTSSSTFTLTVLDPCLDVSQWISIVPTQVENLVAFQGYNVTSQLQYTFNDSVSFDLTQPTDSFDFCGEKILSFKINGTQTSLLGAKNMDFITFSPALTTEFGVSEAQVVANLKNYPLIISEPISFVVTVVGVKVPSIPSQTYTQGQEPLVVNYPQFQFYPSDFDVGPSSYESFLYTETTLPQYVDLQCTCLTSVNNLEWISFDKNTNKLTVHSLSSVYVGEYTILLVLSLQNFIGVHPYIAHKVTILPKQSTANVGVTLPPYFYPNLQTEFELFIGDAWQYSLPSSFDPQDAQITVNVDLGSAIIFCSYAETKFVIEEGSTTQSGQHKIYIQLENNLGAGRKYMINLNIVSNQTQSETQNNSASQISIVEGQEETQNAASLESKNLQKLLLAQNTSNFNWADKFAAALLNGKKLAVNRPIPDVSVQQISGAGLVRLKFTQPMINPPLELIRNTTTSVGEGRRRLGIQDSKEEKEVPAISVKIKPGAYSKDLNFSMSYNITSYEQFTLDLALIFDNPLEISSMMEPDQVEIVFVGNQFFFDKFGRTIKPGKTITATLPKQMDSRTAIAIQSAGVVMKSATNTLMAGNFVLNVVLSASLQQLWSMINTQQIIVLFPLFNLEMPANAQIFYGFIMELASFNILPMQDFYDKYLPTPEWDEPLNEKFNNLGFQSTFFLNNMGTMVIGIAMIPLLSLLLLVLIPLSRHSKRIAKFKNKLQTSLFWSQQIILLFESFAMLCMCAFINIIHLTYDSKCEIINSVLTIVFMVVCCAMPLIISVFLLVRFKNLGEDAMKVKYGELTKELDLRQGRVIILQPLNFLIRRFTIVAAVTFNSYFITQILVTLAGVMISLIADGYFDSQDSRRGKLNVMANECIIVFTLYTIFCFTNFLQDEIVKLNVGYVSCLLIIVHLLINLYIMLTGSIQLLILRMKRILYRLKHKGQQTTIVPKQNAQDRMKAQIMNFASNEPIKQSLKKRRLILEGQQIEMSVQLEEINSVPNAPRAEIQEDESLQGEIYNKTKALNFHPEATVELFPTNQKGIISRNDTNTEIQKEAQPQVAQLSKPDLTLKRRGKKNQQPLPMIEQEPISQLKRRHPKVPELSKEIDDSQEIREDLMNYLDSLFPQEKLVRKQQESTPQRDPEQFNKSQQLRQYFYR